MSWLNTSAAAALSGLLMLAGCVQPTAESTASQPVVKAQQAAAEAPIATSRARPELLLAARDVVDLCMEHMPDTKAIRAELVTRGFRSEGIESNMRLFTMNNRRLIAAATTRANRNTACMVRVSKMTVEEATDLAKPWIQAANAQPVTGAEQQRLPGPAWDGTYKGSPIRIFIDPSFGTTLIRGATLFAGVKRQ